VFGYMLRVALAPGASAEASLAAAEVLQLCFAMFGPEACDLKGGRQLKGTDLGQRLGFFEPGNISDLLNFGLGLQWEPSRSAILRLLLTLPAHVFPAQLLSDLEISIPRIAASDKSADCFGSGAVSQLLLRGSPGFVLRTIQTIESRPREVHSYLSLVKGCLPLEAGLVAKLIPLCLEIAVGRSESISEEIESVLVKNEIPTGGLFSRTVGSVDCRGHSESEDNADWLAVREALMLLSSLLEISDATGLSQCRGFLLFGELSDDEALGDRLGQVLLLLMLSVKHIGAIAGLQNSLTSLTKYLLARQDSSRLNRLPKIWLGQLTCLIAHPSAQSTLRLPPALRRSHGLGHGVAAILQAEVDLSLSRNSRIGRYSCENINAVISTLCETAESGDTEEASVVHALNVLMTIARNSALATPLDSHVGRLLSLASGAMKRRDSWKVRTAGNLLFVNVSRRLVGTDNESEANAKSISADEIFSRFPGLFGDLLSLMGTGEPECALVALLIMLRLSGLERPVWLHAPRDLLIEVVEGSLLGSKALHVRTLAARLLVRLFRGSEDALCDRLLSGSRTANRTHGVLLVVSSLPPRYVSILGKLDLDKFRDCGPIAQLVSRLRRGNFSAESVQPVYASWSVYQSPQHSFQAFRDESIPTDSKRLLATQTVKSHSRELVLASLPFAEDLAPSEFSRIATDWLAAGCDVKALAREQFSGFPGFSAVVAACARNLDDSEARMLAARFPETLPVITRLDLLLDETPAVRKRACLPGRNLLSSAIQLVSQLTTPEVVSLGKRCLEAGDGEVHNESWLLPQLVAAELAKRYVDLEGLACGVRGYSKRATHRLFALAAVSAESSLRVSSILSDDLAQAMFLFPSF